MRRFLAPVLVLLLAAGGCGVNPVTGKREIQFISESSEVSIGEENYLTTQQAEGGTFEIDPGLTRYVASVGKRLAAVSDRSQLPYEFVVINGSDPNAWTLPGGKIGVNRGLLLELENEAELAGVLGHEVVHAAARHPAKAVERGTLLQAGLMGLGIALGDRQYGNLIVGGAALGAGLVASRYGRDQELEADQYGMKYMSKAGYDPAAAVTLQEKFVRLFEGKEPGWLGAMFASHPPSPERVAANRSTATSLPAGGTLGREEYREATAKLRELRPAYTAFDEGRKALAKGDERQALLLAKKAIKMEPREALFYGLHGDAAARSGDPRGALRDYEEAIERNPRYFQFYVGRGLAHAGAGDRSAARRDLQRSLELLPTAPAHYALGELALDEGRDDQALGHFRAAAGSQSEVGQRAAVALARLDIPNNPEQYVAADARSSGNRIALWVQNRSPVPVRDVVVEVQEYNKKGRLVDGARIAIPGGLDPGTTTQIQTHLRVPNKGTVSARVVGAEVADSSSRRRRSTSDDVDFLDLFFD